MGRGTRWVAHTVGREVLWGLAAPVTNVGADAAAGVLGAWDFVDNAATRTSQVRRGVAGLHATNGASARSRAAQRASEPVTEVRGEWFHGGGDRTNALAQIGLDFEALRRELVSADLGTADQLFLVNDVAPVLAQWQNFVEHMASSVVAAYTVEWSVFESWWERLHVLRQLARARGIVLTSPEPIALPKTVWERGSDGTGSGLDGAISLAKTAVFGVIAITGLAGFYAIFRDMHKRASKS